MRVHYLFIILFLAMVSCTRKSLQKDIATYKDSNPYLMAITIGEYVHLYPTDWDYLPRLAKMLLDEGYFKESILVCDQLINNGKKEKEALATRAVAYYKSLLLQESLEDFEHISSRFELSPRLTEIRGDVKKKSSIFHEIQTINQALRENPDQHELLKNRAGLFMVSDEFDASMLDYSYYLQEAGYDDDAAYNLFRLAILQGYLDKAQAMIDTVTKYESKSLLDKKTLANLLEDTRQSKNLIQNKGKQKEGKMLLAKVYMQLKMEEKAISILEELKASSPNDKVILYRLAILYSLTKNNEKLKEINKRLQAMGHSLPKKILEIIE